MTNQYATSRRGFFGSVLGFIGTTAFAIEEAKPILPDNVTRMQKALDLFKCNKANLFENKIASIDDQGRKFWAPSLISVERNIDVLKIKFTATPIKMSQQLLNLVGCELVGKDNIVICGEKFHNQQHLMRGDELKITYTLDLQAPSLL